MHHTDLSTLLYDLLLDVPYEVHEKKGYRHVKKSERVIVEAFAMPERKPVVWIIDRRVFKGLSQDATDFEVSRRKIFHQDRPLPNFVSEKHILALVLGLCEMLLKTFPENARGQYHKRITEQRDIIKAMKFSKGTKPTEEKVASEAPTPKASGAKTRVIRLLNR